MMSSDSSTPTLIKLGLFALALTIVTGAVWSVLLLVNFRTTPAVPWAAVAMALLLWLAWRALSSTPKRRARLRATRVPAPVFAWALVAGLLSIVALVGLWIVLMQLVHVHGNVLPDFSRFPIYTVVLIIGMASIATAVAEEAGFRGYFQGAMEPRFGPRIAIFIAALIMEPGHGLTQGLFDVTTIMFYYCVDIMLGSIAYLTKSIVPGIVVHAIGLAVFFSLVWPFDSTRRFVPADGADLEFWLHVAQLVLAGALALIAFRRLAQITAAQRVTGSVQT
jgi:membrane protease YdiL (CAAX protease family)